MFSLMLGKTLHPYELQRLKQVMSNRARLKELGILDTYNELVNANSILNNKKKPTLRNSEDSESEYLPSEEDLVDDDSVKVQIPPSINMMFAS
jgi:hypothetical protein